MTFKANNPGCPCCDAECTIASDNFNRANSSSLGSPWDERAGDWEIVSNQLEIDTTDALLLYDLAHPDATPSMYAKAIVTLDTVGDEFRLIVARNSDTDYLFVQLRSISGDGQLRLGRNNGGTISYLTSEVASSNLGSSILDDPMIVTACYHNGTLTGNVEAVSGLLDRGAASANVTVTGQKAGLGTGSTVTGTIKVDSFLWSRIVSTTNPTCPGCWLPCASCEEGTQPVAFQVEFSGVVGTGGLCGRSAVAAYFNDTVFLLSPVTACDFRLNISPGCDMSRIRVVVCTTFAPEAPTYKRYYLEISRSSAGRETAGNAGEHNDPNGGGGCSETDDCSIPETFGMLTLGGTPAPELDWSSATATVTPIMP